MEEKMKILDTSLECFILEEERGKKIINHHFRICENKVREK